MKSTIMCNMCEWEGNDEGLVLVEHLNTEMDFYACPKCKTDAYLRRRDNESQIKAGG